MEFSEFTLRIFWLFLPGIISFIIVDKLTIHKETKMHQIVINSMILGFVSYLFCFIPMFLFKLIFKINYHFVFLEALTNNELKLSFSEIISVTLFSVPIGFLAAFLINNKFLFRIAHRLNITRKIGDADIWSYIMNLEDQKSEWVLIRDMENDLMYEGYIEAFSDSTEIDELFLRNVKVFKNSTAQELYEVPGLYLPRKRENLVMEFNALEFKKYDN